MTRSRAVAEDGAAASEAAATLIAVSASKAALPAATQDAPDGAGSLPARVSEAPPDGPPPPPALGGRLASGRGLASVLVAILLLAFFLRRQDPAELSAA